MTPSMRIRQIALVARDLGRARTAIEGGLGLREPFADPGVGEFGLANAVYEAGSDFVEIVSPDRPGTTAGRYLDRRGDGGYMVLLQVGDRERLAEVCARLGRLGARIAWAIDLPDIASCHVHPRDLPGAIVSFDAAHPAQSWRWGGPRWTGGAPADPFGRGGIAAVEIAVPDPAAATARWREALGCALDPLPGGQSIRFVPGTEGLNAIELTLGREARARVGSASLRSR